jgi:iron complex transport system ATP-binding protein
VGGAAAVLESVQVTLGGRSVLGPIDLVIGTGEHWTLLGPNGAGKTTMLSIVGAERHPSHGVATVLGERLGRIDVRELRKRIGVVGHRISDRVPPQATTVEIVLTGRDGLLAPWWGTFDEEDRSTARALLMRVGCGELIEQSFGQCSQGERQRVLLARSLFGRHPLLLLDEPSVGVDFPGREALIGVLDDLAGEDDAPTTVHVVHTLEELPSSTTHAALLRAGALVAAGPIASVLTADILEATFDMAFVVEARDGRYAARAGRDSRR